MDNKMTRRSWYGTGSMILVLMGTLTGCDKIIDAIAYPSVADVKEFARLERELMKEHGRDMTTQHGKMHPEVEGALIASNKNFQSELERIGKETDAIEGTVAALVKDLATRFASLPAGASIAEWVKGKDNDQAETVRTDRATALATTKDEAIKAAEKLLSEFDKQTRLKFKAARERLAALDKETRLKFEAAQERLSGLDEQTRLKLASVNPATIKELDALKDNDTAFRDKLQEAAQLTDKQMEGLKGLSTDDIIAMLIAAGGATAAGGALGKTGKSRSHADIEKIKETLSAITTAAALEKPSPSVRDVVLQGTDATKS